MVQRCQAPPRLIAAALLWQLQVEAMCTLYEGREPQNFDSLLQISAPLRLQDQCGFAKLCLVLLPTESHRHYSVRSFQLALA